MVETAVVYHTTLNSYCSFNSFENFNKSSSKACLILFSGTNSEDDSDIESICDGINKSGEGTGEDVDDSVRNGLNKCERLDANDRSVGVLLDDGATKIGFEPSGGVEVYPEVVGEMEFELDNGNDGASVDDGTIEELMVELDKSVVNSTGEIVAGVATIDTDGCATLSFEVPIKSCDGFDAIIEADVEIEVGKGNGEDNAEVYSIFGNKSIELGFIPNNPQGEIECTPAFPT